MPAHSAPWPTRCGATPAAAPPSAIAELLAQVDRRRRSRRRRRRRRRSGTTSVPARRALGGACARGAAAQLDASVGAAAVADARRARRAAAAAVAPRCGTSTAASVAALRAGEVALERLAATRRDCEPGTSKPPPVRCSDCRAANGSAASRATSHSARARGAGGGGRRASRRSMRLCTAPRTWLASQMQCPLTPVSGVTGSHSRRRAAAARRGRRPRSSRRPVALRLRQHPQRQAVGEREEHVGDGLGSARECSTPSSRLAASSSASCSRMRDVSSRELGRDLLVAARRGEQLEDHRHEAGVVADEVLELGRAAVEDVVGVLAPAMRASSDAMRMSQSRRTTSTSSRSLVPK